MRRLLTIANMIGCLNVARSETSSHRLPLGVAGIRHGRSISAGRCAVRKWTLSVAAVLLAFHGLTLQPAKAADSTVTALTAASAFAGTELLYVVQSAADRKGTPAQMATYVYSLASGDCTITSGGAVSCTKFNGGTSFGSAAGAATGTSGATLPFLNGTNTWSAVNTFNANDLKLGGVTGSTQCLHADTTGVVTGTGSDCGAGGGTTVGLAPYNTTNFYIPWGLAGTTSTGTGSADTVRCFMAYFKGQATVDTMGTRVNIVSAGGNFQLAIYAISTSTGLPTGSALATTGNLSTTTAGIVTGSVNSGTPVQLGSATAGLTPYAFCINGDTTAGTTASYNIINTNLPNIGGDFGASSAANLFGSAGGSFTSLSYNSKTFGTWPSLTAVSPSSYNAFGAALPYFHLSSVP